MSTLAVMTNCGLVCFTGSFFDGYSWFMRVIFFVIFEHSLFLFKNFLALVVPDEPEDVLTQLGRQEFIASKIIDNLPDDDFEDEMKSGDGFFDYLIFNLIYVFLSFS